MLMLLMRNIINISNMNFFKCNYNFLLYLWFFPHSGRTSKKINIIIFVFSTNSSCDMNYVYKSNLKYYNLTYHLMLSFLNEFSYFPNNRPAFYIEMV